VEDDVVVDDDDGAVNHYVTKPSDSNHYVLRNFSSGLYKYSSLHISDR
jgi:hypothetical protein